MTNGPYWTDFQKLIKYEFLNKTAYQAKFVKSGYKSKSGFRSARH